jgi:glyoxylase-like metal-dependent hydrolase (beta-lactamase superfamily II)
MITKEIFQIGGSGFTSPEDAAVYLIHMDGRAAVVDAGCGNATEKLLENIRSCNVPYEAIDYLLITHCHFDHTGGAAEVKKRLNLKIVAHARDAEFLEKADQRVTAASWYGRVLEPLPVDIKLTKSEEVICLGAREIVAMHMPGHSPGSLVYQVVSEGRKVLFAQDVHGPIHPDLLSNSKAYQRSLKKMLELNADILCEGHYGVFMEKEAVRAFVASFVA